MSSKSGATEFLSSTGENADLNQYWYSAATLSTLAQAVEELHVKTAFLSTPSVYFSISEELRSQCALFDYDDQWNTEPGFVRYDFNVPTDIPAALHGTFDCVVIDPPFITQEVWRKYAETAKLLLRAPTPAAPATLEQAQAGQVGAVLGTTIAENAPLLVELFGAVPSAFQPSIPHLVYQYDTYANWTCAALAEPNPEIP